MSDRLLTDYHPPKPRLTLRIGITGHRPNKLSNATGKQVELQLRRVFATIEIAAKDIFKANAGIYADKPPQFRLVSGFAEGADQLALLACPHGWLIEGILPFPEDEYLKDFSKSAGGSNRDVRHEFLETLKKATTITQMPLPTPGRRDQGYLNAGSYLLRQLDVLITVWDGTPPKLGGTGAIAKQAYEGGIPVIWLSTLGNHAPRLITDFNEKGDPIAPEADCTQGPLLDALMPLFAGPSREIGRSSRSPEGALKEFYSEVWRPRCYFPVYDFLMRISTLQRPRAVIHARSFESRYMDWDEFLDAAPAATDLRDRLRRVLLPRFIWADTLAVHFSHLYRSAYVLAYFLSAVAVFIGLGGMFSVHIGQEGRLVFVEFVVIGVIIALIYLGRHRRWHERWLDYRALAESLRHERFLAFISEFGRFHDSLSEPITHNPPWTLWYLRTTLRELGLPSATLDSTYQWRILSATKTYEIDEQIKYHEENRQNGRCIDHLLQYIGISCFLVTFSILAVVPSGLWL
jgi:hypothetical protein